MPGYPRVLDQLVDELESEIDTFQKSQWSQEPRTLLLYNEPFPFVNCAVRSMSQGDFDELLHEIETLGEENLNLDFHLLEDFPRERATVAVGLMNILERRRGSKEPASLISTRGKLTKPGS